LGEKEKKKRKRVNNGDRTLSPHRGTGGRKKGGHVSYFDAGEGRSKEKKKRRMETLIVRFPDSEGGEKKGGGSR